MCQTSVFLDLAGKEESNSFLFSLVGYGSYRLFSMPFKILSKNTLSMTVKVIITCIVTAFSFLALHANISKGTHDQPLDECQLTATVYWQIGDYTYQQRMGQVSVQC